MTPAGIILAGGEARRMGGLAKGQLPLPGGSPMDRLVAALRDRVDPLLICGWPEDVKSPDIGTIVPDQEIGDGPLCGLYSGLVELEQPALVMAWDQIGLNETIFDKILGIKSYPAELEVLLLSDGGWQPFPGLYRAGLTSRIQSHLKAGEGSLKGLLRDSSVAVRSPSKGRWKCDPAVFRDLDRWSDYRCEYRQRAGLADRDERP